MEELEKAYQDIEMLKALGLPVSKEQFSHLVELEKENGTKQRIDIKEYYYKQLFVEYTKRIQSLRQAKFRGVANIAKPVLLLTIIDSIEEGRFLENRFKLTDWFENRYVSLMKNYMKNSQFPNITDISNPFWHLSTDGFWHLNSKVKAPEGMTPSKKWLKEQVEYACLDDDLWVLLQNQEWRKKVREFIISHKLK